MQIKKYKNRKLYNLDERKYTTVKEIAEQLPYLETLVVIDDVFGDDITKEFIASCVPHLELDGKQLFGIIKHLLLDTKHKKAV